MNKMNSAIYDCEMVGKKKHRVLVVMPEKHITNLSVGFREVSYHVKGFNVKRTN